MNDEVFSHANHRKATVEHLYPINILHIATIGNVASLNQQCPSLVLSQRVARERLRRIPQATLRDRLHTVRAHPAGLIAAEHQTHLRLHLVLPTPNTSLTSSQQEVVRLAERVDAVKDKAQTQVRTHVRRHQSVASTTGPEREGEEAREGARLVRTEFRAEGGVGIGIGRDDGGLERRGSLEELPRKGKLRAGQQGGEEERKSGNQRARLRQNKVVISSA